MLEGHKWFHFIGIGGIGMSALAHILLELGHKVTGSDIKESEVTKRLQSMGIKIELQHHKNNISREMNGIVVSTAIKTENQELTQGRVLDIPVIHRGDLLAEIFNPGKGIAVAGAHGKTTTTAMLAVTLAECGLDPTVLIGGDLPYFNGNAKKGSGEYIVAEADESDGSFLKLHPYIGIITNIEDDHLDYYGSLDKVEEAFSRFCSRTGERGMVVACADDPKVRNIIKDIPNKITYGFNNGDITAKNISYKDLGLTADIFYLEQKMGTLKLNVPGKHNLLNALGVIGVGIYLGLDFQQISKALAMFTGVKRRFQIIGHVNDIVVVDDYAHHPTEIMSTLKAARDGLPDSRIIAVFQPHRYSRTKALYRQFATSFVEADVVILDEIYGAGETPIPDVDTELIVREMNNSQVIYCRGKEEVLKTLKKLLMPGDLIITMGAGDIWQVAQSISQQQ